MSGIESLLYFLHLESETLTINEQEWIGKIYDMMLSLRQQVRLREAFENEHKEN